MQKLELVERMEYAAETASPEVANLLREAAEVLGCLAEILCMESEPGQNAPYEDSLDEGELDLYDAEPAGNA